MPSLVIIVNLVRKLQRGPSPQNAITLTKLKWQYRSSWFTVFSRVAVLKKMEISWENIGGGGLQISKKAL